MRHTARRGLRVTRQHAKGPRGPSRLVARCRGFHSAVMHDGSEAPPVAGLLLAGGRATRMGGGDKCLRPLAGRPLLAHVLSRLRPQVRRLVLNANGDASRFSAFGLPVVADGIADFAGPLAGILAGLEWAAGAAPDCRLVLSAPTDAPFLPRDLVRRLLEARGAENAEIAMASSGGRTHPVAALWPV